MAEHNILGKKGEIIAKEYLVENGFEILALNWRYEKSEVDLICRKDNILIFVEVKTRQTLVHGYPEEAVDSKKQLKLMEAAERYLDLHNVECEIRFDILSIILSKGKHIAYHIEDAFFPYQE